MKQKNPQHRRKGPSVYKSCTHPRAHHSSPEWGRRATTAALGLANTKSSSTSWVPPRPTSSWPTWSCSLMAGAFMIAGGLVGTIGWRKNFPHGRRALCAAGELVMALSPNMTVFIWGLVSSSDSEPASQSPRYWNSIPHIYHGKNRMLAFGCIGAASGLSAFLPLFSASHHAGGRLPHHMQRAGRVLRARAGHVARSAIESPRKLKFDGIGTGLAAVGLFLFLIGLSASRPGLIEPFAGCPFCIFGISRPCPWRRSAHRAHSCSCSLEKRVGRRTASP